MTGAETPDGYFRELWNSSPDPWDHTRRWYERRKHDLTIAVLPDARYRHAVEPACGVGLLTERLARRAAKVSASDRYPRAVEETASRCRQWPNVDVGLADVRSGPPEVDYDLAVLGEVLYYFDVGTTVDIIRRWHTGCTPGGHVVLIHYRPAVPEHVLTGDDVHDVAHDLLGTPLVSVVDPLARIDIFAAAPGRPPPPVDTHTK